MGFIDEIEKALAARAAHEQFLVTQRQQKLAWDRFWTQYWLIALVGHEAIKESKELLKVQIPSMPRLLMPPNYKPQNINDFGFVLKRNSNNSPCSEHAVLPHEVARILTDYFKICGFANFKVICTEDTYKYYIIVRALNGFYFGRAMTPNSGTLFRDSDTGMLGIKYFDGGEDLIDFNKPFNFYLHGQWLDTAIAFNDFEQPYLTRFDVHPYAAVGYIAHL